MIWIICLHICHPPHCYTSQPPSQSTAFAVRALLLHSMHYISIALNIPLAGCTGCPSCGPSQLLVRKKTLINPKKVFCPPESVPAMSKSSEIWLEVPKKPQNGITLEEPFLLPGTLCVA